MTLLTRILISFALLFNFLVVSGQQSGKEGDKIYGLNPLLYNGRTYTYFLPLNTGGNQYFNDNHFETGSITIRGVTFNELALNYDIYNQELILKYTDKLEGTQLLVVSDAWLESFRFNGLNFEVISPNDTTKRMYQVLGTGPARVLYFWRKELELASVQGAKNHKFTSAKKEMNLYTGGNVIKYRTNKSFCSLFDPSKKISIKEYLHKNKINVRKATDQTMTKLISYCNSLYSQ